MDDQQRYVSHGLIASATRTATVLSQHARRTGARFNIFNAATRVRNEAVHSDFIAALLDPVGDHGQGTLFLDLFLAELESGYDENASSSLTHYGSHHARVRREQGLSSNRRTDIDISTPTLRVIIENKIDDDDSKGQLQSYMAELDAYESGMVVYLTPHGYAPNEWPHGNHPFRRMAYVPSDATPDTPNVLRWIHRSLKYTTELPRIREGLIQYKEILQNYIGGGMNDEVADSLVDELRKPDNFAAAPAIGKAYERARARAVHEFFSHIGRNFTKRFESLSFDGEPCCEERTVQQIHQLNVDKTRGREARDLLRPRVSCPAIPWQGYWLVVRAHKHPDNQLAYIVELVDRNGTPLPKNSGVDELRKALQESLSHAIEQETDSKAVRPGYVVVRVDTGIDLMSFSDTRGQSVLRGNKEEVLELADDVAERLMSIWNVVKRWDDR